MRTGRNQFVISVVTELELVVRPIRQNDRLEMERIRMLLEAPGVYLVDLDRTIARRAAELRATTRLDLADAAIVATGLETRCDVIVGNDAQCARRVTDIPYVLLDALVEEQRR